MCYTLKIYMETQIGGSPRRYLRSSQVATDLCFHIIVTSCNEPEGDAKVEQVQLFSSDPRQPAAVANSHRFVFRYKFSKVLAIDADCRRQSQAVAGSLTVISYGYIYYITSNQVIYYFNMKLVMTTVLKVLHQKSQLSSSALPHKKQLCSLNVSVCSLILFKYRL